MKKVAFAVAAVSVLVLSACSSGPTCKKFNCDPACKTDGTEVCDFAGTITCVPLKNCSPACTGTDVCDYTKGTCGASTVKTCSPTCPAGMTCDATKGTCITPAVCTPTCKSFEYCTQ
jgi:hypothetical protein